MKKQLLILLGLTVAVPAFADLELADMQNVTKEIQKLGELGDATVKDLIDQNMDQLTADWTEGVVTVNRILKNLEIHLPKLASVIQDALTDNNLKNLPAGLGKDVGPLRGSIVSGLQETVKYIPTIRDFLTDANLSYVIQQLDRSGQLPVLKKVLSDYKGSGKNFYDARIKKSVDALAALNLVTTVNNINQLLTQGGYLVSAKVMLAVARIVPAVTTIIKNSAVLAQEIAQALEESTYVNPATGEGVVINPQLKEALDVVKAQAQNAINAVNIVKEKLGPLVS